MKLLIFLGATIVGYGGWWLGEQLSDGIGWPFFLSSVGTVLGVIIGWRIGRDLS